MEPLQPQTRSAEERTARIAEIDARLAQIYAEFPEIKPGAQGAPQGAGIATALLQDPGALKASMMGRFYGADLGVSPADFANAEARVNASNQPGGLNPQQKMYLQNYTAAGTAGRSFRNSMALTQDAAAHSMYEEQAKKADAERKHWGQMLAKSGLSEYAFDPNMIVPKELVDAPLMDLVEYAEGQKPRKYASSLDAQTAVMNLLPKNKMVTTADVNNAIQTAGAGDFISGTKSANEIRESHNAGIREKSGEARAQSQEHSRRFGEWVQNTGIREDSKAIKGQYSRFKGILSNYEKNPSGSAYIAAKEFVGAMSGPDFSGLAGRNPGFGTWLQNTMEHISGGASFTEEEAKNILETAIAQYNSLASAYNQSIASAPAAFQADVSRDFKPAQMLSLGGNVGAPPGSMADQLKKLGGL
jgi:hypothetical protein